MQGHETVADVYCGTGTITLFLAQKAKKVYGIEIVAPAIRDAVKNAADNGVTNAEFILGDAVEKLPELIKSGVRPDVIVLDPVSYTHLRGAADLRRFGHDDYG